MFTTDLALRMDPAYETISRRYHENPEIFAEAFSKAWYKLTHRDMGPRSRYLGPWVPSESLLWQDPLPDVEHELVDAEDVVQLKVRILGSGPTLSQFVTTAWASASTFRGTDKRGGANGARIRLAPQKDWYVNRPDELATVLTALEEVRRAFNGTQTGNKAISLADLIVLGGCAAVERAAKDAGHDVIVQFTPGRTDASQDETDVEAFAVLEPIADGFRNYQRDVQQCNAEELLVEKSSLLTLSAAEMVVLLGGLRVLSANFDKSANGVFTNRPGAVTNDFYVNLLDTSTTWQPTSESEATFEGRDRTTNELKWTGTRVDLLVGSNSQLRAVAEVYASSDAQAKFVRDFVAAWEKVMNLDRFDLD